MTDFASRLVSWQKIYGRHDLPWQNTTDAYAIWVSEIMLQQTQVSAVIGYYSKFMASFPNIAALANASQDEVLQHWSGLGYYSRARNLHNAAQTIVESHAGQFPQDFETIQTLSGIGRSTAAAIASFAFHQVQTILDGNVKRVLARYFAISGWTSAPKTEKILWQLAESLLPKSDMVAYTQGLMDLGATVCTRSKPKCALCPLNNTCKAYAQGLTKSLPTPKPKKNIPEKNTTMLILRQGDEVMLIKRPATGIWGGLWCFPEHNDTEANDDYVSTILKKFGINVIVDKPLSTISHAFTHFRLHIKPQLLIVTKQTLQAHEATAIWLNIEDAIGAAIPTPVRNILLQLKR